MTATAAFFLGFWIGLALGGFTTAVVLVILLGSKQ